LKVLTTKIRPSKPRVREEYKTSSMHILDTNKVPRFLLQFLWICTHLGRGKEPTCNTSQAPPHHQLRLALQLRPTLPGATAPASCHVLCPNQVLLHMHNLDERDGSRKHQFDRMDEVVITWIKEPAKTDARNRTSTASGARIKSVQVNR
jgi:hypothetical protein